MNTTIRPQFLLSVLLILSVLISACAMPIAPASRGNSAPAASGEGASSEAAADSASAPYERPASAGASAPAEEAAASDAYRPSRPGSTTVTAPDRSAQYETVTAGVTDDNAEWTDYLDYLSRNRRVYANQRDVSERYIIQVVDESGLTVHDATVEIYSGEGLLFSGRTDAGGQVLFHPLALENRWQAQRTSDYRVVATKGYVARSETFTRYNADQWTVTLGEVARPAYAQLDLLFLIDATGSMGDEIDKLKATMADIADQIATLPEQPDVRYGLVAYRDRGDAFVVRSYDFTPNLDAFQRTLAALRADGGGDEPEALNEALHRSLNELSWRGDDTVRLAILVADAPPHLDYRWEDFSYDSDMIEAVRMGIKIFPVGASNLNSQGEYIFRQLAQFTGGKFVFLTYADGSDPSSGPGSETDHDVDNYSVDTLDRLVVRLVRDELGKLSMAANGGVPLAQQRQPYPTQQRQPSPVPTATPMPLRPVSCTIENSWSDCDSDPATAAVVTLVGRNIVGQGLYAFDLDPRHGYERIRFAITYAEQPTEFSVDIGEVLTPEGLPHAAGAPQASSVQVIDDTLLITGDRSTPTNEVIGERQLLYQQAWAAATDETLTLEISADRVAINGPGGIDVVTSDHLFHGNGYGQAQRVYAAFNRSLDGEQYGSGVGTVVVTLYPAR